MVVPILTFVSIESNNSNPLLAGITDTVSITFTADQPITIPTVTIDTNPADSITNTTGNTWIATRKMILGDTAGIIPFTIDFTNLIAEPGVQVTATTDLSSVTFNESINTILKFADINRVYDDIGKVQGDNLNRDNLVTRADEDASSELEAIFLNLVDFDTLDEEPWFVDLATKLTTAIFWKKSNGTDLQMQAVKDTISEAQRIKEQRFFPQEYR